MSYGNLIIDSLTDMMVGVNSFLPTLLGILGAFGILIIGWIIARFITRMIVTGLRAISFDKYAGKYGLTKVLKTGDVKHKPSSLVGCIVYLVMMVGVLLTTVKVLGIPLAENFLGTLFSYIPHVIVGALTLIIGMLLAQVTSTIIYLTAKNTDMPIPEVLRDLTKYAIVIYVTVIYLKEIGFVALFAGVNYTIFMGGIVFAVALAFGLAGKDIATRYLHVFKREGKSA